jgi:putative nucleotidyltransferase with HDIG domain
MVAMDELRKSVRKSLPEVNEIEDKDLGDKVVDAWAFALSKTEFTSIEQIRASGLPDSPALKNGTQADHMRATAVISEAIAAGLEKVHGDIGIDHDLLLACALCHDVGKPFEFSPSNQTRWKSDVGASGYPAIRHPVYGAYVALTVGLPEAVVHSAGAHSAEGELIERSLENTLVHYADHIYWEAMERAGQMEEPEAGC